MSAPRSSSVNETDKKVGARRAIEALRAGVPNHDAVAALGCQQPQIEERFRQELERARSTGGASGLLVEGGFGTGKSHLFVHLERLALAENFVCSRVVVSKETPLHDPLAVYRSACESATVPGRRGSALTELAVRLNFRSEAYREFYEWTHGRAANLDARFPASLFLFQQVQNDPELIARIVRFWDGDQLGVNEFKQYLKACGASSSYRISKTSTKTLAPNYFDFTSHLIRAVGHSGWVILIDEVELIGRYPLRQRARSYGEIAQWMGEARSRASSGIVAVLALTDDFRTAVLDEKGDAAMLAGRIRANDMDDAAQLAAEAECGMRVLERGGVRLKTPDAEVLRHTEARIREIHGDAYAWAPPQLASTPRMQSARIRQLVKSWITQWDLMRLDPGHSVEIEIDELNPVYSEDENLGGDQNPLEPEA